MMNNKSLNTGLLSFPVIRMAAGGNVDAINAVLKHYEGYITALSTKRPFNENDNTHLCVDDEIKRRLETKLITKILTFKVV